MGPHNGASFLLHAETHEWLQAISLSLEWLGLGCAPRCDFPQDAHQAYYIGAIEHTLYALAVEVRERRFGEQPGP